MNGKVVLVDFWEGDMELEAMADTQVLG